MTSCGQLEADDLLVARSTRAKMDLRERITTEQGD
jgi:hypothetical protein